MKEHRKLEFKAEITNTFLKTVSAYSNFGDGEIWFGINDNGDICGIKDLSKACLDIENKINDSITPKPEFQLLVDEENSLIKLVVKEGIYKPYLYKSKAYRRSDTASVEVDTMELKALILKGSNLCFEELSCGEKELSFRILAKELKAKLDVDSVSCDVLRTLGLFTKSKEYNNAAAILADGNSFPGIDLARFGKSISQIYGRKTYEKKSVLALFDDAVKEIEDHYTYEEIVGTERKRIALLPQEAYREAVANALLHRDWSIGAHVHLAMYADRIEIVSPGGLPYGISVDEYLQGGISNLRNPILGNIFYRLGYVEIFGTGIKRILEAYSRNVRKPRFIVSEKAITVILPVTKGFDGVSKDELKVINVLEGGMTLSSREIADKTGFTKSKVLRLVDNLKEKHYLKVIGSGRSTQYTL